MRTWKTESIDVTGKNNVACLHSTFGLESDFFPDKEKTCWCEYEPYKQPHFCANYDEECLCEGNIYIIKDAGVRDYADTYKG